MSKFRNMLESTFKEFLDDSPSKQRFIIEVTKDPDSGDDHTYYIIDTKGDNITINKEDAFVFNTFEEAQNTLRSIYKNHINRPTHNPNEVGRSAMCCFVNGEFRMYEINKLEW